MIESLPAGLWDEFLHHPFVRGMADGTLPKECFMFYLKQDYLYLQHYARSAALAAYKCKTNERIFSQFNLLIFRLDLIIHTSIYLYLYST